MPLLLAYASITAALYYLGSRAVITQPLWSRYPRKIARFMDCAACTGFWYGLLVAFFLPPPWGGWYAEILVGLGSISWTPVVANLVQTSLQSLGTAVEDEDEGTSP